MPGPDAIRPAAELQDWGTDLALLREAAREAGRIAAHHFERGARAWDKGDGQGPVTEADLAVNDFLHGALRAARPGYGWLSEESAPLEASGRLEADTLFVVDPIDGTRAFIDGQHSFAHALAVVRHGVPVAAVVHLPMKGLIYEAAVGQGARLNGEPIAASSREQADGATILTPRVNLDPRYWPGGLPRLEPKFRASVAWRIALVGQGRYDAMLTLRDSWDWDLAASTLIATEAGAVVTDRHGRPLRFNSAPARSPGVVAAGPALHARLLAGLTGSAP